MKTMLERAIWTPKRAAIGAALLALVLFVGLSLAGYGAQWLRYNKAVARAQEQAAAQATTPTEQPWWETAPKEPRSTTSPSATPSDSTSPTGVPQGYAPAFTEDLDEHAEEEDPAATDAEIAAARSVASAFVSTWLTGRGTTDLAAWIVQLAPLSTVEVTSALPATQLEAIPAATLTETAVTTSSIADVVVRATLSDGTALDVTVSATGRGWLVADYAPAAA